ncbi:AraC family transcriptional regulator [Hymenobacter sp. RP-2-7]|uniref:AraC family transcriptional regulator n=1 Tax=Hymenobacter polaris TaxID=2682546 RepID=A0A7Y0AGU9_9BACT|nr:helix-turn-helix domain-containing protein [Hymenobacter polaris]NML66947.1 AraC family transcriptional regulator [Hymenobacter polaris]
MLYVVACGGILLLAFLLGTSPLRVNRLANGWLSFFLLCLGSVLLSRAAPTAGELLPPGLPGWLELLRLAMAPALYLSVRQFIAPHRAGRALDAVHFAPWLLFLLLRLPPLLGHAGGVAAWPAGVAPLVRGLVLATPKAQAVGYWLAAYLLLRQHQRHPLRPAAQLQPGRLRWLQMLLWGLALLVGLWLLELLVPASRELPLLPACYLAAVGYLAYYALRQPEAVAFVGPRGLALPARLPAYAPDPPATPAPAAPAGRQPRLSPSQLAYWQQRLLHLLATTKPYLQPDLSLPALAQQAGLSTHELSYVLNEGLGVNFFQFINRYRVEEAKRLLAAAQHHHLSMVGIAFEAGFSSKTTFNTAFKKATGLSPSQFLAALPPRGGPAPAPPVADSLPSGSPG